MKPQILCTCTSIYMFQYWLLTFSINKYLKLEQSALFSNTFSEEKKWSIFTFRGSSKWSISSHDIIFIIRIMFFCSSHLEVNSALEYFELLNRIAEFYFYWQKYPYFFHCEKIQEAITSTSSILASTISPWPCVESEGQFSPGVKCPLSSLEPLLLSPLQKKNHVFFLGFSTAPIQLYFSTLFHIPTPPYEPQSIFLLYSA